jgi:O-antigen ligase
MRLLLGAGSALVVVALITSTSRGALMAAVVAAAVYAACWLKRRARFALAVVLGAGVFVSVVGAKLGTGYEDVLGETSTMGVSYRASSNVARAMVYVETLRHWRERPLLGWGTQRVLSVRGARMPPMGSHSTYLAILFKNGVLGLAAYVSIVFLVVREVWRARSALQFNRARHDLLGLWFLGLVANLAHGLVADMNDDLGLLVLVWIFWGVLVQYARVERSRTGVSS